ncbi:MAG: chemotaxis protein CheX [Pseudomonadales bacterium]|nr:chemotaxis protein CheX [Pseudomonadales bacterium]
MDVTVINPFITGLSDVLTNMTDIEFKINKIHLKTADDLPRTVTGFIDLSAETTKGSLAICFDRDVILEVYEKILGEAVIEINEDVEDCVGEITNMVCGTAKALLAAKGHQFELTTPSVILGDTTAIPHFQPKPIIVIPFSTEKGDIHIEVTIKTDAA